MNLKDIVYGMKNRKQKGIGFISSRDEYEFIIYHTLYENILKMSARLRDAGIQKNQKVIFQLNGLQEFVYAFWACIINDMIAIPMGRITNKESLNRLAKICSDTECTIIYDEEESCLANFENVVCVRDYANYDCVEFDVENDFKEDKIAFVQYSSGSTGNPKGVVLSHENIICNANAIIEKLHIADIDQSLSWLPLSHDMGLIGFHIVPVFLYANHYIMSTQLFLTKPVKWIEYIEQYKITMTGTPNFALDNISAIFDRSPALKNKYNLSSLRIILNGSEAISVSTVKYFNKTFENAKIRENVVFPVYGLTEGTLAVAFPEVNSEIQTTCIDVNNIQVGKSVCFCKDKMGAELVSVGSSLACSKITIRNDQYEILGDSVAGHVCIEGGNVAKEYIIGNEFVPTSEYDFLDTGDIGYFHNGNLYIIGRENEFVLNGRNFYLSDAESIVRKVFNEFGLSIEICLIPIYDGKIYNLILFVKNSYSIKVMRAIERTKVDVYAETGIAIDGVMFVDDIPYTISRKIKRLEIRSNYANEVYENKCIKLYSAQEIEMYDDIQHIIMDIFQKSFGFKPDWNDKLSDFQIASLEFYMYLGEIEECLEVYFEMDQMWDCTNLAEFYERMKKLKEDSK